MYRRTFIRRFGVRKTYRQPRLSDHVFLTRSTSPQTSLQIAGGFSTGFHTDTIDLAKVQTADLIAKYKLYRIKYVDLILTNRVDPANSGVSNNSAPLIVAACDPASSGVVTSMTQLGAYDNHKASFVPSGRTFTYRFYPKVTNTVNLSGVATAAGSYNSNPWLRCDATGVTIPHLSCVMAVQNTAVSVTTLVYSYYYRIGFEVKQ